MSPSLGNSVLVALYSTTLLVLAYVFTRRNTGQYTEPEAGSNGGLFRGAGLALCTAAMMLPLARLAVARDPADILVLLGTVAAAGVVMLLLLRSAQRRSKHSSPTQPERTRRALRVTPRSDPPQSPPAAPTTTRPPNPPTMPSSMPSGMPARPGRPARPIPDSPDPSSPRSRETGTGTAADQASEALQDVEAVVDDYAARLGLRPPDAAG